MEYLEGLTSLKLTNRRRIGASRDLLSGRLRVRRSRLGEQLIPPIYDW